ncbi:MAG: hypothetical protein Q9190_002940 [Brigantiaea leucoxantha]
MKWSSPFTRALTYWGFTHSNTAREGEPLAFRGESYGIKEVVPGVLPALDIIAVHGLNGHWEKTWSTDLGVFWLRDLLPKAIPNARILSYGYDARTHGSTPASKQYIWQHAHGLVSDLAHFREETETVHRPIIFIAHSLGGLVVKSALIHADLTRQGHLERRKAIKNSTHGVNFVGTPHQGGNGVEIGKIIVNVASAMQHTTQNAVQHLSKHSEWLQQQTTDYLAISADFETVCFYETYRTALPGLGHLLV